MSKRLKLSDLAKVVAQKAATSASKGVVISEGSETTSGKRALDDGSKGKQVAQPPESKKAKTDTGAFEAPARPPVASGEGSSVRRALGEALGPQASVMASAATAEKILAGVILPADKEKVDRLTFDQVVTKFIHAIGQGVILGSSLAVRSRDFAESALNQKAVAESAEIEMGKKLAEDADARSKVIAKLEARISELEKSQSLTQGRIIAAFKESNDFLEAVRGSASSYFGDGFDFCKRQLAHQYPDLGVDLEDVEMDHEFLAKEEAEAEQRAAEKRAAGAEGVERRWTHSKSHVDGELNAEWVVSAEKWFNGGNGGFHTSEVGTSAVPFMFSNTNLGGEESEQSLPSWISDHLGAKSYIDETSQSPSFPPTNSPKMDTSSLTKEARQGEVAFYEAAFLAGLRLPLHPTIREILIHYKICPAQLSPNAWRSVICSLVIWRHFKRHMSCDEFRCLYSFSPLPDSGWYYFKARPEKNLLRGSPSNGRAVTSCQLCPRWTSREDENGPREDRARRLLRGVEGIGFVDLPETLCGWLHGALYQWRRQHGLGRRGTRLRISYLGHPAPVRIQAMSARGKAKAEKATKTAKPPTKGVVIREKRAINARGRAAEAGTSSPGGDMGSESMSDASVARRLLTGVIPASDKKEVDQLSENELVAKSFHALGQVVVFASSLALRSQEHLHDMDFHMARADSAELELVKAQNRALKAENKLAELSEEGSKPGNEVDDLKATVAELTNKLAKAKELAIEDFKTSGQFKAAVTDSAAMYFSEGFEFCKRQLIHQFPNLGVDVANMAMDPSFAEEEEAMKEGEDPIAGAAPNV
ncbi:hypothetical protein Acr_19g0010920 [Actinidia rufa]|uniref:Transposase (putative) gypsy type domain-containing protein n=1 Tax=Actinidia rufa TaxID=165716 RepID=A0A7J0GBG2_9ERIC|nr:hypothetical protein Acr_19g0010920 [Actinidia rufa]